MITIILARFSLSSKERGVGVVFHKCLVGDVSLGPGTLSQYQNLVQLNFAILYYTPNWS